MRYLIQTLTVLAAINPAALTQTSEVAQSSHMAQIGRQGETAVLSAHTFRPLDAIATQLQSQFGIAVSAEDPVGVRGVRSGTVVPAAWGFEVRFPLNAKGFPQNVRELLASIVAEANVRSSFAYRLDEVDGTFAFVPTQTRDAQGRPIAMTPLLDRPVTLPPGVRRVHESASLMAAELSRQTGLQVSCCQSAIAGYPWGMEEVMLAANGEPARSVLRRLGLNLWHMRCDDKFCFIDLR